MAISGHCRDTASLITEPHPPWEPNCLCLGPSSLVNGDLHRGHPGSREAKSGYRASQESQPQHFPLLLLQGGGKLHSYRGPNGTKLAMGVCQAPNPVHKMDTPEPTLPSLPPSE